jgi:hypothetical protein
LHQRLTPSAVDLAVCTHACRMANGSCTPNLWRQDDGACAAIRRGWLGWPVVVAGRAPHM